MPKKLKIEHTLIMAAGRGTRMIPLTNHIPKAMAQFRETTLIATSIEKLKRYNLNIHITVGYKGAELAKHVIEHDVSSILNTEGKGNAWWIFNTLMKFIDEPVLVLTCDNITDLNIDKLNTDYIEKGSPACMVIPVKPVPGLEGDYIFHENYIVKELNRNKLSEAYCSGIQILNPAKINGLMNACDDFYTVWQNLIATNALYCCAIYPDNWFTIDTLDQLMVANSDPSTSS
jgi:NDP-sugar pyrophosphorylase family protein